MRRSLLYVSTGVAALALVACGGREEPAPTPGPSRSPESAASEGSDTPASEVAAAPEFANIKELARASAVQTADLGPGWTQEAEPAGFARVQDPCAAGALKPVDDEAYAGVTAKHKDAEAYVSSEVIVFPLPRQAKAYIGRRNQSAWAECQRAIIEENQREQDGDGVSVSVAQTGNDPALGVDAFAQFDVVAEGATEPGRIVRYAFRTGRVVTTVSWDAALSEDDPNELDSRTFEDIMNAARAARKRLTGSG